MITSIRDFILHLRLNYQLFILSGPYLLGVLLSNRFSFLQMAQFFSIHILLFGGVTAYNSYFDKDTGPIGGLRNPPPMSFWMLVASWALQALGFMCALWSGVYFAALYVVSVVSFWMYSSPHIRLKSKPIGSVLIIGFGTAAVACLFGYYANGFADVPTLIVLIAALGSMFLVVSMYPLSQAYQIVEDTKRKDSTFAVTYGKNGIRRMFITLFPIGLVLVSDALQSINI